MKFDINYHYRMARECQVVLPTRLIYLRTALAHASLASCYRHTYARWLDEVHEEALRRADRVKETNVKLYREERAAGR